MYKAVVCFIFSMMLGCATQGRVLVPGTCVTESYAYNCTFLGGVSQCTMDPYEVCLYRLEDGTFIKEGK